MKIHTFWNIILKMLGIYLILSSLSVLGQTFSSFSYFSLIAYDEGVMKYILIAGVLLTAIAYFLIIKFVIFNSNWIIKALRLEKGFKEDKIDLSISMNTVLSVAIIVFSGFMFVKALPEFIKNIIFMIQSEAAKLPFTDFKFIILYGIQLFLAYLLIANHKAVVRFIIKSASTEE